MATYKCKYFCIFSALRENPACNPDNANNLEQLKCRWRRIWQISVRYTQCITKDIHGAGIPGAGSIATHPFPFPCPCTHADCNRFTCALLTIVKWHSEMGGKFYGKTHGKGKGNVRGTSLTPHVAGDRCVGLQIVPGKVSWHCFYFAFHFIETVRIVSQLEAWDLHWMNGEKPTHTHNWQGKQTTGANNIFWTTIFTHAN